MSHSEFPESPVSFEGEQSAVTDSIEAIEEESPPKEEQLSVPKPKRRWPLILGILLVITGIGFGWRWWQTSLASNGRPKAGAMAGKPMGVSVKLATVETETVQETSEFVGSLEAPRSVVLKPEIAGRISEIVVKEGDRVEQGQVIIRLQSDDAQAQLSQAKAALETSRARLAELKAGSRTEEIALAQAKFTQAQSRLTNAQTGSSPEEIAQAQSQIEVAKSELELAKSRAIRYENLRKEGAISQDQLEGYTKEQRNTEAKLQEAQRRLEQVRKTRSADINQLTAALEQEKQNLKQLKNGTRPEQIAQARSQVIQAAAQVRANEVQLQHTNLLAPFTGIIGEIPVRVGEYVDKGAQLTTLTKNDSLKLNISIPLNQAKQLRLGLPVQMLDIQGKPTATGKVSFISPDATLDTQTVLVKASFGNSLPQLLNRQSVQTKIIWNQHPGIKIPITAVSRVGGENFVFVAQSAEKLKPGMPPLIAVQKPIKLGAIEGNNYQILQGLKPGDKIVISGILNLTNGVPIIPLPTEIGNKNP